MCLRVVDENVEGAAGDFGNFGVACLDALGVGDVEREGAHAQVGEVAQDRGPARRGDDMEALLELVGFEFRGKYTDRCTLGVELEGQRMSNAAGRAPVIDRVSSNSSIAMRDVIPGDEDAFLAWLWSHLSRLRQMAARANEAIFKGIESVMKEMLKLTGS